MSSIRMSKIESGMRVALEFNEAFNRHDVAGILKCISDDCVFEDTSPAPDGAEYQGKESISQFFEDLFREVQQAHAEIEEIFGFGLRVVMRWRCEWLDETGAKQHVRGVDIFKLKDGLICEKLPYVKGWQEQASATMDKKWK